MLDPDQAATIAELFDLGGGARLTGTVVRGEQGQVEQLETARGLWAVKTSFSRTPADRDGEDAAFQAAALAAGVPAPEPIFTCPGEAFADVGPVPVRVYSWVDVLPTDRCIDPAQVGNLLARLHQVDFAGRRPQDEWYSEPVGAAGWDAVLADLEAAGAPFASAMAGMRDELVALDAELRPPAQLRTCHRDLWADNLRAVAGGGFCVIDWDNCGLADPTGELAEALFEFAYRDVDRARELGRAYRDAGGSGRVRDRASFSMAIAELGHIAEISCRIWLDPTTTDDERLHQAGRLKEFIDQPLTLEVIDELVAAVAD